MLESVTTTHLSGPWWAAPPFLMRGVFSPLAFLPPFPIASGSGGYPRVFNPLRQPAGLRLEPGLGMLGGGALTWDLHVHFCLLEEKGGSQQPVAFPLTLLPATSCAHRGLPACAG